MSNVQEFKEGFKDGFPIGMGYLAVSIGLGIAAHNAKLSCIQGFMASLFTIASAGEFACFQIIELDGSYMEVAVASLVANARYMLMSCALGQRLSSTTSLLQRLMLGQAITDEVFGISLNRPAPLNPYYSIGAICFAAPMWALGTAIGILLGDILPEMLISAMGVALYGMFIACIIPPARTNYIIGGVVAFSFAASYVTSLYASDLRLSGGTCIILLTVIISTLAAVCFPLKEEEGEKHA